MASHPDDLLTRWREAEGQYRVVMDRLVGEAVASTGSPLTKQRVLEVEQARATADLRRERYFVRR